MNQSLYRVIFNKTRGIMMAVQEGAHSQGKGTRSGNSASGNPGMPLMRLANLAVAVAALFGSVTVVQAQIVADPNAGQRRPVVDISANGRPLVQITTPSAAGVSHNQYSQFNVSPTGVILNNATTTTPTQLGGYVAGNPYLATGGARIILNEVTGTSQSSLRGYTEVAGRRAEVIIANPNGITCDGCGFINTSRGVLTTGTPVFGGDGSLEAFRVTGGQIQVGAGGLNAGNTDQLDLISRSLKVNGELWANNLNVVTGANQVNYSDLGVQVIQGDANKPTVGIDVSNLGGMYANKIRLVGTEAGVGVVSAGNIAAQISDLSIDNQGKITLTGNTSAAGNITIQAGDDVANSGTLYGKQNAQITSTGQIINAGTLSAQSNLGLNAASVNSIGVLGAGVAPDGSVSQNGNLNVAATGDIVATGKNLAGGDLAMTGSRLNLSQGQTGAAGAATLKATAGDIDNTGGNLQAAGSLTINATGGLKNDRAQIGASQVTVHAASLGNRSGTINQSGSGDTTITVSGALDNTGGVLATNGQNLVIQSGSLVNNATNGVSGFIGGNGNVQLTAASVDNTGGTLYGKGDLAMQAAGALTNQGGVIQTDGNLNVTSGGALNNTSGRIESNGAASTASITASGIDNTAGRIANQGTGSTTINGGSAITNANAANTAGMGTIGGNGDVALTAATISNTQNGKILAGGKLDLNATAALDNSAGTVSAVGDINLNQTGATISNAGGNINAGGDVALRATSLDNTGGNIKNTAGSNGNINVILSDNLNNTGGAVSAQSDLTVNANTLVGNGQLVAGRDLTLGLQGDYTNTAGNTIKANRDLTLSTTGTLANAGTLESVRTVNLNAANIDNQDNGLINGQTTIVKATNAITNTGRIYGDDVALGASTFTNDVAGGTWGNPAGVVAARNTLNIGAVNITNREGGWLYSNGDMAIGRSLSANNQATGMADQLLNASSRIETGSGGNMTLNAASIINRNDHFSTTLQDMGTVYVTEYQPTGWSTRLQPSDFTFGADQIIWYQGNQYRDWYIYQYSKQTQQTVVQTSAPAEILVGANLTTNGAITNDKSRIVAGGAFAGTANSITNIDEQGSTIVTSNGTVQFTQWYSPSWRHGSGRDWYGAVPYNDSVITPFQLGIVAAQSNTAPTNNANPAAGQTVAAAAVATAAGGTLSANQGGASVLDNISNPASRFSLPNNRLFQLRTEPGQPYLIETDPRFTNYSSFLSSDYMLRRLSLDPQAIQKRLGDGFYEQKLINDQITQLTGRRYLDGYVTAEDEFRSLMDSGIAAAQQFNLVPGVTLTAAQVAALTHDIVWMVEQTVTLPNGSSTRVLAPVVYLSRATAADIKPSGALISAEAIDLKLNGTLQNSGTLQANSNLLINAGDIRNSGNIRTQSGNGSTTLVAVNDVVNAGGAIEGHRVGILAGRDILMETGTNTSAGASVRHVDLGRVASVNADQLTLQAGRDLNLTGAQASVKTDATLMAGRDINLNAVKTETVQDIRFDARNRLAQSSSDVAGTQIQADGNLMMVAGQDIKSVAGTVNADGNLTAVAGRDITLGTAQKTSSFNQEIYTESNGFLSSSSKHTLDKSDSSQAVGSSFSGKAVTLQANRDLGISGSAVVGSGDVTLTATTGNVSIAAAQGSSSESHFKEEKQSGVFASGVGIGITIGSREQKSSFDGDYTTQSQSRSTVGSTGGNVVITAGKDAAIKGSDLIADRAVGDALNATGHIDIQAQNITIDPGQDASRTKSTLDTKSSGLTIALVGTPLDTYRNIRDAQQNPSKFGRVRGTLDEIGASAMTMPQVAINFDRSQSHSEVSTSDLTNSGSSLTAAGDIRLRATGNGVKDAAGRASDGDITVTGSTLNAGGLVQLDAERNLTLQASTDRYTESSKASSSSTHFSTALPSPGDTIRQINGGPNNSGVGAFPYGKATGSDTADSSASVQSPTLVSGQNVILNSRSGDIRIAGSAVNAIEDISVAAQKGRIDIASGEDIRTHQEDHSKKLVGDLGKTGSTGTSNTVGVYSEHTTLDSAQNQQNTIRSQLAAGGNLTLDAKEDITVQGADLRAGKDLTAIGRNIALDPGQDTSRIAQTSEMSQAGVTLSMSGYAVEAAQALEQAAKAAEQKDNKRLAALYGAKAALTLYNGLSGIGGKDASGNPSPLDAAGAPSNSSGAAIKATVSIGSKSASSQSEVNSLQNQGSTLTAGQTVTLIATGNGDTDSQGKALDGDITARGTRIAGNDVLLAAARDITLQSAQDTTRNRSSDQSNNASIGIGFGLGGSQNGFTLELAAAKAEGKANGDSTTNQNTQVTAANTLTLQSGRDTNLLGAQVRGDTVNAAVGRDLNVASPQDTDNYKSSQSNAGFSASICIPPFCYGATVSASVAVGKGNTDSTYQSTVQQSGVYAGNGGYDITVKGNTDLKGAVIASQADAARNKLTTGTLTTSDLDNKAEFKSDSSSMSLSYSGGYSGKDGSFTAPGNAIPGAKGQLASGTGMQTLSSNLAANAAANALPGQGGTASGTTKSAISEGTIVITDEAGQQQKTGKTAEETIASLNRDTANANGSIGKIFDQAALQREQEERKVLSEIAQQAAPIVYKQVGDLLVGQPTEVKVAVHALVGGVMSKLIGGDFGSGAAGAGAATLVVETFGKDIAQIAGLNKADQDALVMMVGLVVGKVASAAAGADSAASNAAAITAKLGVENNYLKHREILALEAKLKACGQSSTPDQCRQSAWNEANAIDRERQRRQCEDANQCRSNRDEILADRQELALRQEELDRKLYAGQLTKDEQLEYQLNAQQLSRMSAAWEEANRQVRNKIPFSQWTAEERAQTFQDAILAVGGLRFSGAVGNVRGVKREEVVVRNFAENTEPNLSVNMNQQNKHIIGTNEYKTASQITQRSPLAPDIDPQALVNQYAGTGQAANKVPLGQPGSVERITTNQTIGIYYENGVAVGPTTNFTIRYSKDGVHIIPARP